LLFVENIYSDLPKTLVSTIFANLILINILFLRLIFSGDGKDVGGIKEKSQGVNKIFIYCPYMDLFFQLPKAVNSLKVLAELPIIVVLMYQVH